MALTIILMFDSCYVFFSFIVLLYPVFVYTGSKRGAGTNANVFIDIFGERGDTGNRPLLKSKSNRNKFERNQVTFHIKSF